MEIKDLDDEYVTLAQEAMEGHAQAHIPGAYWVEYFPIMKHIPSWVPGASFRKLTERYRPIVEAMIQKPFERIRNGIVRNLHISFTKHHLDDELVQIDGTAPPSVARTLITNGQDQYDGTDEQSNQEGVAMRTLAIAFAGGPLFIILQSSY